MMSKLDLAELHQFEMARDLSVSLLEKWLAKYKFKDWTVTETRKQPIGSAERQARAKEMETRSWTIRDGIHTVEGSRCECYGRS